MMASDDGYNISTKKRYLTLIIAIHLAAMQQFSGVNAISLYAGQISSKIATG
jgi:hypothetical protein